MTYVMSLSGLMRALEDLSAASALNNPEVYSKALERARLENVTNEQIKDAYLRGRTRAPSSSMSFRWDGTPTVERINK